MPDERPIPKSAAVYSQVNRVIPVQQPEDFHLIKTDDCAALICERQLGSECLDWLQTLPANQLPETRQSLPVNAIQSTLLDLWDGVTEKAYIKAFTNDIADLAYHFAATMGVDHLVLRLEKVTDNACRKFHQDYVTARLICTYRGRGTQYGLCQAGPMTESYSELQAGVAAIFKGRRWGENKSAAPSPNSTNTAERRSALYHRSPPIEGSGETRLLLVLDPDYEASTETA